MFLSVNGTAQSYGVIPERRLVKHGRTPFLAKADAI
jgi:hypothetical protein